MTTLPQQEVGVAALSRLLALGFSPPREEGWAEIGALARGLGARPGAAPELAELLALLGETGPVGLELEFERLFSGETPCPPYEGSYAVDPFRSAREMADVSGFYLAFGAEPGGPAAERPDHIGCELEFLSFLALKRLGAFAAGEAELEEICREAEDAFLCDHLGRFGPPFFLDVREHTEASVYDCLARLGERFLSKEVARRGLEPESLRPRPRPFASTDAFSCGDSCGLPEALARSSP